MVAKMNREAILQYAKDNVEYYRSHLKEKENINLFDFPIISKEEVKTDDTLFRVECIKDNVIRTSTSGTCGQPLTIFWDKKDYLKSNYYLWKMRQKQGITPLDKCCQFHTYIDYEDSGYYIPLSPKIFLDKNAKVLSFSKLDLDNATLKLYYDKMMEFEPRWLFTQPSILVLFCDYLLENNLTPPSTVVYIELTGEFLYEEIRIKISQTFNKAVIRNHYGAQEFNCIGYECEFRKLHILTDNVLVEVLEDDSICVTGLRNYAMPLIRYKLGDKGRVFDYICPCGNTNPIIEILSSRSNDRCKLMDGQYIEANIFYYIVQSINSWFDNCVLQFKVTRKDKENMLVIMVLKDLNQKDEIANKFIEEIQFHKLLNFTWTFEFQDKWIKYDNSGKLCYFKNEYEESDYE